MAAGADRQLRSGRRGGPRRALAGVLVALTLGYACADTPVSPPPEAYDAEGHRERVEEWRRWRHDQLAKPDGWLSLAGLYWLQPGVSTFGAAEDADLIAPREDTPGRLGTFEVAEDRVVFTPGERVEIRSGREVFRGGVIWRPDEAFETQTLEYGTLAWFVIERSGRLGVRLRDSANPVLVAFEGMDYFPLAREWRIDGRFEPYDPPRTIRIPNVLGTVGEEPSEGAAVFTVDGTEYRIDLWRDSDDPANFFTAFGDATNGAETYGGGRFLWIDAPDEHGRLVIDFNRAYNPPCVFTPYATCPLPPPQNRLDLEVRAGELSFEGASG